MSWQPIDFQGIVSLDNSVVDSLEHYLAAKEADLSYAIQNAMPPFLHGEEENDSFQNATKLSEAIDFYIRKEPHPNGSSKIALDEFEISIGLINEALWKYLEILEDSVSELFLQLEHIGLEQWHSRLPIVLGAIKDLLIGKTEEFSWGVQRLEKLLKKYRLACEPSHSLKTNWVKLSLLWKSILDPNLLKNAQQTQDALRLQYQKFMKRYRAFLQLEQEVDKHLDALSDNVIFQTLEKDSQKQFAKLYQLLKLWELNQSAKALPNKEFILAFQNTLRMEKASGLFKRYQKALNDNLYESSIELKYLPENDNPEAPRDALIRESVDSGRTETHLLGATVTNYREFLLQSDPDPYARARLGLSNWEVSNETTQHKPLLDLNYELEELARNYDRLSQALQQKPNDKLDLIEIDEDVQDILHDMSQPLITQRRMRYYAEEALEQLEDIDELCSFDPESIDYTGEVLSKLLRADWKYHVLHGINRFHEIYRIHQGLIENTDDRVHSNRLEKFQKILNHITESLKNKKNSMQYQREIDLDINDIHSDLQDFLGYIQRILGDSILSAEQIEALKRQIKQQLMDYRYIFGDFFYKLQQNVTEGTLIRRQLLFVDQYFETIEQKTLPQQEV